MPKSTEQMIKNPWIALRNKKLHILVWSIFITWEVLIIGIFSGVFGHPLTYLAHYLIIIIFFYLHSRLWLPALLRRRFNLIWSLPLIVLVELAVFILFSYLIDIGLYVVGVFGPGHTITINPSYITGTAYRALYFLGFSTGYYYLETYLIERKKAALSEKKRLEAIIEREKAEKEIIKAQNAFLAAQINPHFFFNTLDFLYHNILAISPSSAEAISHLAGMMRFAMDANTVSTSVRLGDEIEQVENLISLYQLRSPHYIKLQVESSALELLFIPLVVLTLTENVFKHGELKKPEKAAVIKIWCTDTELRIETTNWIRHSATKSNRHGLSNTKQRLHHAYDGKAKFLIKDISAELFQVAILVPLNCLESASTFSY